MFRAGAVGGGVVRVAHEVRQAGQRRAGSRMQGRAATGGALAGSIDCSQRRRPRSALRPARPIRAGRHHRCRGWRGPAATLCCPMRSEDRKNSQMPCRNRYFFNPRFRRLSVTRCTIVTSTHSYRERSCSDSPSFRWFPRRRFPGK
ncbi:hypothetical protein X805_33860 [Sphaerotilus natans subsp. natans DSM 6575]|uniref:Uncharacterized protein n=1 Tax=Sphaerotilus natans subsp. natans DSM 6575 TaxID=1286631 RepID=A0A059KI47_9BURK|nr:hypothetical protein X805_33860 [Sphaerotilus natans subsp. natans DSM 6575]